jgi:hypothetical protein
LDRPGHPRSVPRYVLQAGDDYQWPLLLLRGGGPSGLPP